MCVVATDAPLLSSQLERLARRVFLGIARVGNFASNGSGEVAIAFSTANREAFARDLAEDVRQVAMLANDALSPLFAGVVEGDRGGCPELVVCREGAPRGDGRKSCRHFPPRRSRLVCADGPPHLRRLGAADVCSTAAAARRSRLRTSVTTGQEREAVGEGSRRREIVGLHDRVADQDRRLSLRRHRREQDALAPNGLPTSTSAEPTLSIQVLNAAIRSAACSGVTSDCGAAGPR